MPQTVDWNTIVQARPLLAALPDPARRSARALELAQDALLFHRGDRPRAMFFVMSGEVRLTRPSRAGSAVILQRARGGFVAEASLDQPAYHCDAIAAERSVLLAVPRKAFIDALDCDDFRRGWFSHLTRELRRVRAHAERLSLNTAWERIVHYIEAEGDGGRLQLTQSKKAWAAELGLTHEALYRALAQMQRDSALTVRETVLSLID